MNIIIFDFFQIYPLKLGNLRFVLPALIIIDRLLSKKIAIEKKNMNNLEKLLFLEFTNKQYSKFPNKEYYDVYNILSEIEKSEFTMLAREIREIWNYINSPSIKNVIDNSDCKSIKDYNNKFGNVNEKILQIARDFEINLETKMDEKFKNNIISLFGKEYFENNFGENGY